MLTPSIYSVNGQKVRTLYVNEDGLKLSSKAFSNAEEFEEAYQRKLSLQTKSEIPFDRILSITREEGASVVKIRYRTKLGFAVTAEFSFRHEIDFESFLQQLQRAYFQQTTEKMTALQAVRSLLFVAAFIMAATIFLYYLAIDVEHGTASPTRGRGALLYFIVRTLGKNGVLAVGSLIFAYLCYQIYRRYANPPNRIMLSR